MMRNGFELAGGFVFSLLLLLLGNKQKKSIFPVRIIASWMGMCLIFVGGRVFLSTVVQNFGQLLYIGVMCLMFLLVYRFCYHTTMAESMYINLLSMMIFEIAWNIWGILENIVNRHIQTLVCFSFSGYLTGVGIVCTSVCFCTIRIFERCYKQIPNNVSAKEIFPMYFLLMLCTMILELCRCAMVNSSSELLPYYICALVYSFVGYAAWIAVMQVLYYRPANEEIHCFLKDRTQYYAMSQEAIQALQIQCHDLKHQMLRIHSQMGKENLEKYLSDLEKSIAQYDAMIECGNEALNIVLTEKNIRCSELNIQLLCMADGTAFDFLSESEIYSLFGNALENALEGCALVNMPEKRRISLKAGKHGDMVVLFVENFFKGDIFSMQGLPRTTKQEMGHGFGLKSIQAIAEKHGGTVSVQTEGDVFRLNVVMNPLAMNEE